MSIKNKSATVRNLRLAYRETQETFATRMGVSLRTVQRWERGKVKNWDRVKSVKTIENRANYFRYKKKLAYQVELTDMENPKDKIWTRFRDFDGQEEMIMGIHFNGEKYQGKQLTITNYRTVALKIGK